MALPTGFSVPSSNNDRSAHGPGARTERTLDKLRRGGLPASLSGKTWGGAGTSKNCDGCGEPVRADDWKFEVEVEERSPLRFHAECHRVLMALTGTSSEDSGSAPR